ncbi:hypothetical protein [Sphingomonas bacterium]|uniref:hypothetical protein n=1 Tax=Sphingomonas bacterium TaxID=1895847 RepID=UPI0015750AF4|nr:hypothetical protein [Sphingomonas bacterium]
MELSFTTRQRLLLLAGFVALVMLRLPLAWVHGRLQDEEGTVFLAYAWHRPAGEALWRAFAGYLNLGANAVTLLAVRLVRVGILPLEGVPYLTMTTALLVQSLPALLLVTGRAAWLADRRVIVAGLLIVATAPLTEEVFLNTLHIQFHLPLAAALILALDIPASRVARLGYAVPLLVGPLCGPGAIILLPFFVLRAALDRSPARGAQAAVLGIGAAVQLLVFYSHSPIRGDVLGLPTLAAIMFVRLALLPLLTPPLATLLGRTVYASYRDGTVLWWFAVAGALGYFGALATTALRDRRDGAIWLIAAGLSIAAASFGRGMIVSNPEEWFSVGAAERYDFLPLVLLGLGLLALAARAEGRHRRVRLVLCLLTLLSGAVGLFGPLREFRRGPAWPAEVAAWRQDHDHHLATWPQDWAVDLSDRDRPCAPWAGGRPMPPQADYCEAAWLTRISEGAKRDRPPPMHR